MGIWQNIYIFSLVLGESTSFQSFVAMTPDPRSSKHLVIFISMVSLC